MWPRRAGVDRRFDQRDLIGRQPLAFLWHDDFGIESRHVFVEPALLAFSWNERRAGIATFEGKFLPIEPQTVLLLLRTVTRITALSKNGFDVAPEVDGLTRGLAWRRGFSSNEGCVPECFAHQHEAQNQW